MLTVDRLVNQWINKGSQVTHIDIGKAEAKYNAEYVADLCLKDRFGNWGEEPAAVFWQETPPNPTYSNYFGLYVVSRNLIITSAHSAADGFWEGAQAENGEIIFSRFRHDNRVSADRTAMVDGGRDYFRFRGKAVRLRISGPDFEVF